MVHEKNLSGTSMIVNYDKKKKWASERSSFIWSLNVIVNEIKRNFRFNMTKRKSILSLFGSVTYITNKEGCDKQAKSMEESHMAWHETRKKNNSCDTLEKSRKYCQMKKILCGIEKGILRKFVKRYYMARKKEILDCWGNCGNTCQNINMQWMDNYSI